jgi:hypothetical protein
MSTVAEHWRSQWHPAIQMNGAGGNLVPVRPVDVVAGVSRHPVTSSQVGCVESAKTHQVSEVRSPPVFWTGVRLRGRDATLRPRLTPPVQAVTQNRAGWIL